MGSAATAGSATKTLPGISTSPAATTQQQTAEQDQLAEVDSFHHPDARTIRPRCTGEPFDLHSCVQALFTIKLPKPGEDQDQQAA